MRTLLVRAGLLGIVLAATAPTARADTTSFVAVGTDTASQREVGVAFGLCPGIFGWEVEYAGTLGRGGESDPSVGTISGNFLLQTTVPIRRTQFYGIAGFGVYGKQSGKQGSGEINIRDIGAGAKITLAGPLKLRLDYRLFLLGESPDATPGMRLDRHPQRFSAGLSLAF